MVLKITNYNMLVGGVLSRLFKLQTSDKDCQGEIELLRLESLHTACICSYSKYLITFIEEQSSSRMTIHHFEEFNDIHYK